MSEEARRIDLAAAKVRVARRLRGLYSIKDAQARATALDCDGLLCRDHFRTWCDNYGIVKHEKSAAFGDPELTETPFQLWPSQVECAEWLIDSLLRHLPALIVKSRELGITWLILHLIYWLWRFRKASSHVMSRVEQLVDRTGDKDCLFEKLRAIHANQPPHLRERRIVNNHLVLKNLRVGSVVSGSASSSDAGRGGRNEVNFVDEFMSIPAPIAANLIASLEANAASIWLVGTPSQGTAHPSYKLFQSMAPDRVRVMDWRCDPYRDESFPGTKLLPPDGVGLLEMPMFRREYCCDFTAVISGLIWSCNINALTYNDHDFPAQEARRTWLHFGGWDFGSGPSDLVCVFALVRIRPDGLPEIFLDADRSWHAEHWHRAGTEAVTIGSQYEGPAVHFGDPSGIARESDQESWQSKLRSVGIPLLCLPAWFNSNEGKEWGIKEVQLLMSQGRLFVHQRCETLLAVIKQWRRNIPDGLDPRLFERAYIPPRHDAYSHAGYAILYCIMGLLAHLDVVRRHYHGSRQPQVSSSPLPPSAAERVAELMRSARSYQ